MNSAHLEVLLQTCPHQHIQLLVNDTAIQYYHHCFHDITIIQEPGRVEIQKEETKADDESGKNETEEENNY